MIVGILDEWTLDGWTDEWIREFIHLSTHHMCHGHVLSPITTRACARGKVVGHVRLSSLSLCLLAQKTPVLQIQANLKVVICWYMYITSLNLIPYYLHHHLHLYCRFGGRQATQAEGQKKEEPNFATSGKLTAETNTYKVGWSSTKKEPCMYMQYMYVVQVVCVPNSWHPHRYMYVTAFHISTGSSHQVQWAYRSESP